MEEKWKAITIETDEEEEDLEDLIIIGDEDEGMEEETWLAHPPTKFPAYVPPQGRLKCRRILTRPRARSRPRSSQTTLFFRECTWDECQD